MKRLSEILQYNARVSLLTFMLLRNFALVLSCTHVEACCMYFLARIDNFGEDTWLGPKVESMTGIDRYVTSLVIYPRAATCSLRFCNSILHHSLLVMPLIAVLIDCDVLHSRIWRFFSQELWRATSG